MPAPTSPDEFIDLIRKSGVVEPGKLSAAVERATAIGDLSDDPASWADRFIRDGVLTHFQAEQLLQGKWKRFTIGKYKVLERIGAGGMGQVFLCEHKVMKRRVAVKVLPAAAAADPAALARFHREARAVAALDHPNLVRAYDIDQDQNLHFLVLEFVDGTNLQDLVANRVRKTGAPLDPVEACHYISGAAHGLQHAYQTGLVHRDVKPGNILVDRSGRVKVLDLGLARFFHDPADKPTATYDETTLGTSDYIAPEQVADSHAADVRADLYALGGTLYYLLTGRPPFAEGSVSEKLIWHQTREPIPVSELRPAIPAGVAKVVSRLMAKNPIDRFQTPAELIAALAPWVREPVSPPLADEFPVWSLAAVPESGRVAAGATVRYPSGTGHNRAFGVSTAVDPDRHDPAAVWSTVASETNAPSSHDTARAQPLHPRLQRALDARVFRKRLRLTVLVTLPILAIAAGYFVFRGKGPNKVIPVDSSSLGPARLYVSKSPTGPAGERTYATIAAALAAVRPYDTIVLLDPTWDEGPVRMNGRGKAGVRNVTVESAAPGGTTVWRVAGGKSSGEVAVEIVDAPFVTLRGLEFDVGTVFPVGVSVVGICPGLTIDRVTVRNATHAGIQLVNAAGDADAPITLSQVRVVATGGTGSGVAIRAHHPLVSKSIRLTDGRLEGPGKQAVLFDGSAAGVEIAATRVFNWDAGISLGTGLYPDSPLRIRMVSNTFFGLRAGGVRLEGEFPPGVRSELVLTRNLFAKTSEVVTYVRPNRFTLPGLNSTDNGVEKGMRDGHPSLRTVELPDGNFTSTDPQSDQFLRYPKTSPWAAAGPNKVPVGVPPD